MPKKKTTEEFITEASAIHKDKYDYSKVVYVRSSERVTIICKEHGEFSQTPVSHLRGHGCKRCGSIKNIEGQTLHYLAKRNWNFEQPEEYKLIPLSNGKLTKVDNEDFEALKKVCWRTSGKGYVYNSKVGYMHRYIMNAPDHLEVDHIHHDTLDNRKSELRLVTETMNQANRKPRKNATSKYKGVSKYLNNNKWHACIVINGKTKHLGSFDTEEECAKAYDIQAVELFGEYSYQTLNFPELLPEYLKRLENKK